MTWLTNMTLRDYESRNLEYDATKQHTLVSGLAIGLLAGAAVATSASLLELASAGSESVRLAFRIGIRVDQVSQSLEPQQIDRSCVIWTYIVFGLDRENVQRQLDVYNAGTVCRATFPARSWWRFS